MDTGQLSQDCSSWWRSVIRVDAAAYPVHITIVSRAEHDSSLPGTLPTQWRAQPRTAVFTRTKQPTARSLAHVHSIVREDRATWGPGSCQLVPPKPLRPTTLTLSSEYTIAIWFRHLSFQKDSKKKNGKNRFSFQDWTWRACWHLGNRKRVGDIESCRLDFLDV